MIELVRISKTYRDFLGDSRTAADPVLIALALYFRNRGTTKTVVTDDAGVIAVCNYEGLRHVSCAAFKLMEAF